MSAHDMRDALDALSVNAAWQKMVSELRERQEAIIRGLVHEQTPADEREHLATEYRLIESFIGWPSDYRQDVDNAIDAGL
jgi:hypothetical protein